MLFNGKWQIEDDKEMLLPKIVEIVDVAPRDGLQMLPNIVPTEGKVELIQSLRRAGVKRIEAASFVSPRYVPQMADAGEVLSQIGKDENSKMMALALNEKGYRRAVETNVDWICYVVAATETMNRKNANTNLNDALNAFRRATEIAHQNNIKIRGSIAVTWICPHEGEVSKKRVLEITEELFAAGADEVAYNDTVGRATPKDVYELCSKAKEHWPDKVFAAHFHDTNFTALANIYAALTASWTIFDSSVGGLGGCPFSPGASGNVATEKVVWMMHRMGIETGVDEEELKKCAELVQHLANGNPIAMKTGG